MDGSANVNSFLLFCIEYEICVVLLLVNHQMTAVLFNTLIRVDIWNLIFLKNIIRPWLSFQEPFPGPNPVLRWHVHGITEYLINFHFNIMLPSTIRLPTWSLPFRQSDCNHVCNLIFTIRYVLHFQGNETGGTCDMTGRQGTCIQGFVVVKWGIDTTRYT
jgi:hypothetical protein